ncbi:hypothetical protein D9M71_634150 [compost metagenome]
MADPPQQQGAEHHRQAARGVQPPGDLHQRRAEVAGQVVGPGRLAQRVQAGFHQQQGERHETAQPRQQPPMRLLRRDRPPEQQVEQQQSGRDDQRMAGEQGQHGHLQRGAAH